MTDYSSLLHALGELLHSLSECFAAVAWPAAVAVLLVCYRNEVRTLLGRLKELAPLGDKGPLAKFDLGESPKGEVTPPQIVGEYAQKIKREKIANIFWFASDLETSVGALLRRGSKAEIIHCLRQTNHHLKELGLVDAPVQKKLAAMLDFAKNSADGDWTDERRVQYVRDLMLIRTDVGRVIEAAQVNFQSHPGEGKI